jgi:hypothetical protein
LDDAARIIAEARHGAGQPYLRFEDFKALMRAAGGASTRRSGSQAGSGAAVVVVAYVSVDDEHASAEGLQQRLTAGPGLRLCKLGRPVNARPGGSPGGVKKVVGGGLRTFRLDRQRPWLLTWRKGGFKALFRPLGQFDLRLVSDVVAGGASPCSPGYGSGVGGGCGHGGGDGGGIFGGGVVGATTQPFSNTSALGGDPALHLFLVSPVGCLGLAATDAESHRALLDG